MPYSKINRLFYFLLLSAFVFENSTSAKLSDLLAKIEAGNQRLDIAEKNSDYSGLGESLVKGQFGWKLEGGLNHSDSYRDSFFSFQAQRTINDSLSLGLEKSFEWGGVFRFTQGINRYNLSHWGGTSSFLTSGSFEEFPYEYQSRLSYSHDLSSLFWGRTSTINLELAKVENDLSKLEFEREKQKIYKNLTQLYMQASYHKSSIEMTKKDLERYERRLRIQKKRVQDGLSLDVELLQMKSLYEKNQEALINFQDQLASTLENISLLLEEETSDKQIRAYNKKSRVSLSGWQDWSVDENIELSLAQLSLDKLDKNFDKMRRETYPEITLQAVWATNAIEGNLGDAIDRGKIDSRFQDKSIGINVSIPLGESYREIEQQRAAILKDQQKIKNSYLKRKIDIQMKSLKKRLRLLKKKISVSQRRFSISQKILNKYEKLYDQGRVEIDRYLSAEDDLAQTARELIANVYFYELSLLEMAYLTDNLLVFIEGYKG